jgi:dienelactone hydrolase
MVGYNDTLQVPHRFGSAEQRLWSFGPLGMQLWDSIRALDFLSSLEDVDADRMGVTGASGGGTQTFLLTAVDDRVKFASPVNMVSAIMQGGDLCENAPGLRIGTSNVEIAAMFAPKPMLLVSATGDWTRNVPKEEYPAIKKIYDLYGKGDQVEVVQINEQHNFNRLSREAVYRFFAKHNPGLSESRELTEHDIEPPMVQEMTVLSNCTLPADALNLDGLFAQWQKMAQAQNEQTKDRAFLRERLRQSLAVETPHEVTAMIDASSLNMVLVRGSQKDRLPGAWIPGKDEKSPVAIVVDANGSAAARMSNQVTQLKKDGRSILMPDVFQTGIAKAPRPGDAQVGPIPKPSGGDDVEESADAAAGFGKFFTFNVSLNAARVQDIVTAIAAANTSKRGVEIFASGDAAIWATFAAAVSEIPVTLHVSNLPELRSNSDYIQHFNVPGILRAGGLAVALELANQR